MGKNGISLCSLCSFLEHFRDVSFVSFFPIVLYEFFIKYKLVFSSFETIHRQLLSHGPSIKVVYSPAHEKRRFFVCVIILRVLDVGFSVSMNNMIHSTSLPLVAYQHLITIPFYFCIFQTCLPC